MSTVMLERTPADSRERALTPRGLDTRRAIIAAAVEEFSAHGQADTRLVAVARRAYVAPSTISLHFDGKGDLYEACIEAVLDHAWRLAQDRLSGHPYPLMSGQWGQVAVVALRRSAFARRAGAESPVAWHGHLLAREPCLQAQAEREVEQARLAGLLVTSVDAVDLARALARLQAALLVVGESAMPVRVAAACACSPGSPFLDWGHDGAVPL